MVGSVRIRSLALTLGVAALVGPTAVSAADVTLQVTGGDLTASIANATMSGVNYSHTAGSSTGTLVVSVNDERGTAEGWNVYLTASDFVENSDSPIAQNIPNSGFSITDAQDPAWVAGQAIVTGEDANGPYANAGAEGVLNVTRTVLTADAATGSGQYTQDLDVSLVVPAMTQAGTYTSTVTVSTVAAPED